MTGRTAHTQKQLRHSELKDIEWCQYGVHYVHTIVLPRGLEGAWAPAYLPRAAGKHRRVQQFVCPPVQSPAYYSPQCPAWNSVAIPANIPS